MLRRLPSDVNASRDRQEGVRVWAGLNNRLVPLLLSTPHYIIFTRSQAYH